METDRTTFGGRLALAVLEWLDASGRLKKDVDLCLINSVPGIEPTLPPQVETLGGRRWALARVDGDLSLRLALVRSAGLPLVAFSDCGEDALQADLRERAVLRRVIPPLARHLLAAVVNREASALNDDRFRQAVLDVLANDPSRLEEAALRRTWGTGIRDQDAAAIICDAAFGFDDRQSSTTADELLARWILEPPATSTALRTLAQDVLQRRYPVQAVMLERALRDGPRETLVRIASGSGGDDAATNQLAFQTARKILARNPDALAEVLKPAESEYVRETASDREAPLLQQAYLSRFRALCNNCLGSAPPGAADMERIMGFVYATEHGVEGLRLLARLARGLNALETTDLPQSLNDYGSLWLQSLAWLDRAARRLRTTHIQDVQFTTVADQLVSRWYALRDRWNAAFASLVARTFGSLFSAPGEHGPLVVSQLLKHVVRPRLEREKVFLVVLDGCDIPTFLELLEAFSSIGLGPVEPTGIALSAIPTMTSHARRAIFGGDIPGDGLSDDEERPADASGDRKAFENSSGILADLPKHLFLKGDLADGGAQLIKALQGQGSYRLIAAVFNDVDDALSSKERMTLAERTLNNISRAFRESMIAAADADWCIVVTADHGNTPYREPDIVVPGFGARYAQLAPAVPAPEGATLFEKGVGLPYRIAALHQLGAHGGPQHVGYHGGVSIEEMFVPLAILGSVSPNTPPMEAPDWWFGAPQGDFAQLRRTVRTYAPHAAERGGHRAFLARCREVLEINGYDPKNFAILEGIAEAGVLGPDQLASKVAVPIGRVRLRVTGIVAKLRSAGIESPIVIEDEPEAFRWVGPS